METGTTPVCPARLSAAAFKFSLDPVPWAFSPRDWFRCEGPGPIALRYFARNELSRKRSAKRPLLLRRSLLLIPEKYKQEANQGFGNSRFSEAAASRRQE